MVMNAPWIDIFYGAIAGVFVWLFLANLSYGAGYRDGENARYDRNNVWRRHARK